MNTHDWRALSPSRPLSAGDDRYLPRPWGGGDRLARLILGGLTPIALTGPPGSGKTTELQRAYDLLRGELLVLDVPAALLVDVGAFTQGAFLYELAHYVLDRVITDDPELQPPESLVKDLRASDPGLPRGPGRRMKPIELARHVIEQVKALTGRERLVLLLDGLDAAPPEMARAAVRGLVALQHVADLVIVVPPALANGPDSHEILSNLRVSWVATLPVHDEVGEDGAIARRFLVDLAIRRLELEAAPDDLLDALSQTATLSGGLPRMFLQLLQDAGLYATTEGRDLPDAASVELAARDQADALRRVVEAGDLELLDAAEGSDGLEVPSDRRVRLLSHNLLLEYAVGEDRLVRPHPLVARLLERRRGRAGD